MSNEITTPIGLPVRYTNDPQIGMRHMTTGEIMPYMGLDGFQFLQIIRTSFKISFQELRNAKFPKDLIHVHAMDKLEWHLESMTKVLEHGVRGYHGPNPWGGEPRRTSAGRQEFLKRNPATAKLTPGILALRSRLLKLQSWDEDDWRNFSWVSEIGCGFVEDGGGWDTYFTPEFLWEQVAGVKKP